MNGIKFYFIVIRFLSFFTALEHCEFFIAILRRLHALHDSHVEFFAQKISIVMFLPVRFAIYTGLAPVLAPAIFFYPA